MRAGVVVEVAVWACVTALLVFESSRSRTPWELIGGLVAIALVVTATRRFPLVAVSVAVASGVAMLFDYGGRVPIWPLAVMAGTVYLTRRQYVLRRAQENAVQARLKERARIAADMHDSLGHELALIAVRAGVLQVSGGLDELQRQAVAELRESAAAETDRLREIIEVLREPESITDLVARSAASGLAIKSTVDSVPVEVEPIAYRVVQEALTNAAKHAPGAAIVVAVTPNHVSVFNEQPTEPAGLASGGSGLASLRKRVEQFGGHFEAGPRHGGFAVTAIFKGES
ncbi:histidine kinase [Kibdelosporangium philippinense]|uniref:histidine kinase n=1 Tax=Kibdelosporangium philippinense TaxID=211113 RepID=A0ABS8Z2Y9_9PSEU|nr:histidine kinase [Kibdelosporangium philippinense]MCE7001702.1 histidine kinase [Kibdelosporangium philippinense]